MEQISEEELRAKGLYKRILVVAILCVVAVTIWVSIPPKPIDFTFIRALKPKVRSELGSTTMTFKTKPGDVIKLLDQKLHDPWRKTIESPDVARYDYPGRSMPSIYVSPEYQIPSPSTSGSGSLTTTPTVSGTSLSISDPRGVLVLPTRGS